MGKDIKTLIGKYHTHVVDLRRYFHIWPELSSQEFKTQEKVIAELTKLGLDARKAANTGVIADIQGSRPGKVIAIRCDMDALPLQDQCERPYQSQNPGICHACGHDGHMAMLLGIAAILCDMKDEIAGTVRLIFEPTEECFPGGALALIEAGALEGVSAIIGAHLWQPMEIGTAGIKDGPAMAQPGGFQITITGKGGHASMPHQAVDPIMIGLQIAQAINAISSNAIDPLEPAIATVTIFQAGQIRNIIPATAYIEGSIRVFSPEVLVKIHDRMEQIVKGFCLAYGAEYDFERLSSYLPVINDAAIARVIKTAGIETLGDAHIIEMKPVMAGEDFSYYQQVVPGAYVFIGAGNQEKGIVHPHHHSQFDIDEAALDVGMEIMARAVLNYLNEPA